MLKSYVNTWTAAVVLTVLGWGAASSAQIAGNSKAPIDITANEAEVINAQCATTWRGNAEALQDKTRLRADTIRVFARPKGAAANGPPDCGATDRIEADGHVYYVNPQQTARADRAVYTAASDDVVMTGNVIVVQGSDVARGERLTINVTTHQAKMDAGDGGGRVRAVIYPDKATTDAPVSR
jgi:lipopolysaccharide export system protein LptA